MEFKTKAKDAYESPTCRKINIDMQALICTSPTGRSMEEYEDGDTSGWFNY